MSSIGSSSMTAMLLESRIRHGSGTKEIQTEVRKPQIVDSESSFEDSSDDEYMRLMEELNKPPQSMRKNKALNSLTANAPNMFDFEKKYEIKKDAVLVPNKLYNEEQLEYIKNGRAAKLRSPFKGHIRLCRVHKRW